MDHLRLSTKEELDILVTGKRVRRNNIALMLRGFIWFEYVSYQKNYSPSDFVKYFEGKFRTRSSIPYKWAKKEISPRGIWVKRLDGDVAGSKLIFDLPVWKLLVDAPITIKTAHNLMKPYYKNVDDANPYIFPNDILNTGDHLRSNPSCLSDSNALVKRGDLYGLTAIVSLVRYAEHMYRDDAHAYHCANMYRILPSIGKLPWIRKDFRLLCSAIQGIHKRVSYSAQFIGVNWETIEKQTNVERDISDRNNHNLDPVSNIFMPREDPVIFGKISPAQSVGEIPKIL